MKSLNCVKKLYYKRDKNIWKGDKSHFFMNSQFLSSPIQ